MHAIVWVLQWSSPECGISDIKNLVIELFKLSGSKNITTRLVDKVLICY